MLMCFSIHGKQQQVLSVMEKHQYIPFLFSLSLSFSVLKISNSYWKMKIPYLINLEFKFTRYVSDNKKINVVQHSNQVLEVLNFFMFLPAYSPKPSNCCNICRYFTCHQNVGRRR